MPTIHINPELQSLIPPLSDDEYRQLEANILADGCHDALIVWQETQTLLDGHNRYAICEQHNLSYGTTELSLPDLDSAKAWMIGNQLGRRNLTPEQTSYFRGAQYHLRKKLSRGGGDRKSSEAEYQKPQSEVIDNTAAYLAEKHKVSKATIERDAAYTKAIDTIADAVGPEARQDLLAREVKVAQYDVRKLAKIAKDHPQTAKHVLAAVREAPTAKEARALMREATKGITSIGAYNGYYGEDVASVTSDGESAPCPTEYPPEPEPKPEPEPVTFRSLSALLSQAVRELHSIEAALESWYASSTATEREGDVPLYRDMVKMLQAIVSRISARLSPPTPEPGAQPSPSPRRTYGDLTKRIEQEVQGREHFACADIAKAVGVENKHVWQVLKKLVRKGKLQKDGEEYVALAVAEERGEIIHV